MERLFFIPVFIRQDLLVAIEICAQFLVQKFGSRSRLYVMEEGFFVETQILTKEVSRWHKNRKKPGFLYIS